MAEFDSRKWTGLDGGSSFENIINKLKRQNVERATQSSLDWFKSLLNRAAGRNSIGNLGKTQAEILADKTRQRNTNAIGSMYFFVYDPKWKKTLPYYDKFPLIFPIEFYNDGFLGINLHYLDRATRALLLSKLKDFATNKRYDSTTRLKISYDVLVGTGNLFKPCVKRYLTNHVRTKFIYVDPSEWDNAIYLPVESFEKASNSQVWKDSRRKSK